MGDIVASTTCGAGEGLFGRMKSYLLLQRNIKNICEENYGHLVVEFLWAQQFSVLQRPPFGSLIDDIFEWQKRHRQKQSFETDLYFNLPTHF